MNDNEFLVVIFVNKAGREFIGRNVKLLYTRRTMTDEKYSSTDKEHKYTPDNKFFVKEMLLDITKGYTKKENIDGITIYVLHECYRDYWGVGYTKDANDKTIEKLTISLNDEGCDKVKKKYGLKSMPRIRTVKENEYKKMFEQITKRCNNTGSNDNKNDNDDSFINNIANYINNADDINDEKKESKHGHNIFVDDTTDGSNNELDVYDDDIRDILDNTETIRTFLQPARNPPENKDFELLLCNDEKGADILKKQIISLALQLGEYELDKFARWDPRIIRRIKNKIKRDLSLSANFTIYKLDKVLTDKWQIVHTGGPENITLSNYPGNPNDVIDMVIFEDDDTDENELAGAMEAATSYNFEEEGETIDDQALMDILHSEHNRYANGDITKNVYEVSDSDDEITGEISNDSNEEASDNEKDENLRSIFKYGGTM